MERRLAAIVAVDVVGYSRLMEIDEVGTLNALKACRAELVNPLLADHHGRIVKLVGDGALVEFASIVDAIACAIAIQNGLRHRNENLPEHQRIEVRIGVHVGDIVVEGDDIYGDGVNIAARLEGLAKAGGICISRQAYDQVDTKIDVQVEDLGNLHVKNIARPVHVFRILQPNDLEHEKEQISAPNIPIDIHYCTTSDGVSLAYAEIGSGFPLVKAASFMTHLQHDSEGIVFRDWISFLAGKCRYIRYDERGNGLSDWNIENFSFAAMINDLETVVDAMSLDRFVLLGVSQGASVSIEYAHRHPERVAGLILFGGYAAGWRRSSDEKHRAKRDALLELTRITWGDDNPAGRQAYANLFLPDGTVEQHIEFAKLQQITTTPDNAYQILETFSEIDVTGVLPEVEVPALVMHCEGDAVTPMSASKQLASGLPNARFVVLEGRNHIIQSTDPGWPRFTSEIERFMAANY